MNLNLPIQRHSLADEVISLIKQQIESGKYLGGQQLPSEPELMQQFGVGRSTIREAIRILANSGYVSVRQGLGTFVETITGITGPLTHRMQQAEVADLNEVRQLLELKIAEKAATNRTKDDIKKMQDFLNLRRQMAEEKQIEACIAADINFHNSLAEASGNSMLADLYKTFVVHIKKHFAHIHTTTNNFLETQHLHDALLQSIINGDSEEARKSVEKILSRN